MEIIVLSFAPSSIPSFVPHFPSLPPSLPPSFPRSLLPSLPLSVAHSLTLCISLPCTCISISCTTHVQCMYQSLPYMQYSTRVNQVLEAKRRNGWLQDSHKRKLPVTKDNFFPVPLGRNRKEIAQSWFQDLAGNKPLSVLAKKVLYSCVSYILYMYKFHIMCIYIIV